MKIISLGRGGGKTAELLNYLKYNDRAVIITHDYMSAGFVRERAAKHLNVPLEEVKKRVIPVQDLRERVRGDAYYYNAEFLIDELDTVLCKALGVDISVATITER